MKVFALILVSFSLLVGCSVLNRKLGLPDDNFIEETLEFQIKQHTGLDVDLTPDSPENKT